MSTRRAYTFSDRRFTRTSGWWLAHATRQLLQPPPHSSCICDTCELSTSSDCVRFRSDASQHSTRHTFQSVTRNVSSGKHSTAAVVLYTCHPGEVLLLS